jgi:hypothetical protein
MRGKYRAMGVVTPEWDNRMLKRLTNAITETVAAMQGFQKRAMRSSVYDAEYFEAAESLLDLRMVPRCLQRPSRTTQRL